MYSRERARPLVMGKPQRWIALALEALRLSAVGRHEQAAELRAEAFDAAPVVAGSIDRVPCEWLADADMRIGPFLEVIVNGKYYWVPFHRISRVVMEPPADLRDLVWTPAQFTWANGGQSIGLIPTRYVGTANESDDRLRLARMTDWREVAQGVFTGMGQRVLATDENEYPLLDVREIALQSQPEESDTQDDLGG